MEENGTVVVVKGGTAQVRLTRSATCDRCGVCGMGKRPEITVEVPNTAGAMPGDEVRLAVEGGSLLRAAAAAYIVPLAALLTGFLLLDRLLRWLNLTRFVEGVAIAGGFLAMGLSYLWVRRYDRHAGARFTPCMVAVVSHGRREPPEGSPE